MYDVDFGHQFIETEKYDAKPTYKKFSGYRPGVAVIGDLIVGIEKCGFPFVLLQTDKLHSGIRKQAFIPLVCIIFALSI